APRNWIYAMGFYITSSTIHHGRTQAQKKSFRRVGFPDVVSEIRFGDAAVIHNHFKRLRERVHTSAGFGPGHHFEAGENFAFLRHDSDGDFGGTVAEVLHGDGD